MTRNRLTVEQLAKDTLDVRELNRAGLLTGDWLWCPHCERRVARLFKGFAGYFCRACWVEHLRQCADLANLADRDLPEDRIWCRWLKIPEDDREPEHQRI